MMDWTKTYPALATVMVASFETLCTWHDNLPAPQTDVERTVMRRLLARRDELLRQQVRERAPDIAPSSTTSSTRWSVPGSSRPCRACELPANQGSVPCVSLNLCSSISHAPATNRAAPGSSDLRPWSFQHNSMTWRSFPFWDCG